MHVWILKDGEPLPFQEGRRLLRGSMLARALVDRGHTVTWITSTFVHFDKAELFPGDRVIQHAERYQIHLISAGGYGKNLSLRRYRYYRKYAERLRAYLGQQTQRPDVIVCGFPQIDAAVVGVDYARSRGIPIIVDVRDFWPDSMVALAPRPARPIVRFLLNRQFERSRYVFASATALCAMSQGVLDWAMARGGRTPRRHDVVFPLGYPDGQRSPLPPTATSRALARRCSGKIVLAYAGTFGHTYDVSTIVAAAARLVANGEDRFHVILIGHGPTYDAVVDAARNLENVTFTQWLNSEDVQFLLKHAHVGILPWQGPAGAMPNKFFDYLSAGLPVVSSAQGELNRLIETEQIGAGYTAGDPESLLAAVRAVCANREWLAKQGANARRVFTSRFNERVVYGRFAAHVEEVALLADGRHGAADAGVSCT